MRGSEVSQQNSRLSTSFLLSPGLSSFPLFTTTTTTTASITTAAPTTTAAAYARPHTASPFITRRPPGTTRRPFNGRRKTTTSAPNTTPLTSTTVATVTTNTLPPTSTVTHVSAQPHHRAQNPCSSHPCLHGGTCEYQGGDFSCKCPAGRGGAVCEKGELAVFIFLFHLPGTEFVLILKWKHESFQSQFKSHRRTFPSNLVAGETSVSQRPPRLNNSSV